MYPHMLKTLILELLLVWGGITKRKKLTKNVETASLYWNVSHGRPSHPFGGAKARRKLELQQEKCEGCGQTRPLTEFSTSEDPRCIGRRRKCKAAGSLLSGKRAAASRDWSQDCTRTPASK